MTQLNDTAANSWLMIPWEDYEGHMSSPAVKQLQFLNELFQRVLRNYRPSSVAALGCATGNGFEHIDPVITQRVIGVDINPHYLRVLRTRFGSTIPGLQLLCADLAACELERESFDLVHCALVLEYLEPRVVIEKAARWLRPRGVLVVVLQLPSEKSAKVSETQYKSLRHLEPVMKLVEPETVQHVAAEAGLSEVRVSKERLESGKEFFVGHYLKRSPSSDA
jgi:ubiquinone/menaquinone biosynthesis C-methylase UbiE